MTATGGAARRVVGIDDPSLYRYPAGLSVGPEHLYLSIAEYESDICVMDLEWEGPVCLSRQLE